MHTPVPSSPLPFLSLLIVKWNGKLTIVVALARIVVDSNVQAVQGTVSIDNVATVNALGDVIDTRPAVEVHSRGIHQRLAVASVHRHVPRWESCAHWAIPLPRSCARVAGKLTPDGRVAVIIAVIVRVRVTVKLLVADQAVVGQLVCIPGEAHFLTCRK